MAKLNLNLTRDKSIDKEVKYIDDKELDEYRYTHPYMYKRLLTDDVIELFYIGFDKETNCITMPVHDLDGKTVFIQRRSVNGKYHHYDRGVDKTNYVYGAYECIKYHKNNRNPSYLIKIIIRKWERDMFNIKKIFLFFFILQ